MIENNDFLKTFKILHDTLEELLAIELLDYHNRNHLFFGTNPEKLSKIKQELIERMLVSINYRLQEQQIKGINIK